MGFAICEHVLTIGDREGEICAKYTTQLLDRCNEHDEQSNEHFASCWQQIIKIFYQK